MIYPRRTSLTDLLSGQFEIDYNSPQAAGLVACLPLLNSRGTSVLRDISGRAANGTIGAGVTWAIDGKLGAALSWTGIAASAVTFTKTLVAATGPFTISIWCRPTDATATRGLFGQYYDDLSKRFLCYMNTDRVVLLQIGAIALSAAATLTLGTTYLLSFVRDANGQTVRIYINGVQSISGTNATAADQQASTLGYYGEVEIDRPWYGLIGPVQVNNIALPPPVIWQMYDPATRWDLYMVRRRYWTVGIPTVVGASMPGFIPRMGVLG
jgi:hypothetical protein